MLYSINLPHGVLCRRNWADSPKFLTNLHGEGLAFAVTLSFVSRTITQSDGRAWTSWWSLVLSSCNWRHRYRDGLVLTCGFGKILEFKDPSHLSALSQLACWLLVPCVGIVFPFVPDTSNLWAESSLLPQVRESIIEHHLVIWLNVFGGSEGVTVEGREISLTSEVHCQLSSWEKG